MVDSVIYPHKMHNMIVYRVRSAWCGGDSGFVETWGEFQVKEQFAAKGKRRKVLARFATLKDAKAKYPLAEVLCEERAEIQNGLQPDTAARS